jgi:hypothetical protein
MFEGHEYNADSGDSSSSVRPACVFPLPDRVPPHIDRLVGGGYLIDPFSCLTCRAFAPKLREEKP